MKGGMSFGVGSGNPLGGNTVFPTPQGGAPTQNPYAQMGGGQPNMGGWMRQFLPQQPPPFQLPQFQQQPQAGTPFPGMPIFPHQGQGTPFPGIPTAAQLQQGAPGRGGGGITPEMFQQLIQQAGQPQSPGPPNPAMQYAMNQFNPSQPPAAPTMPAGMARGGKVKKSTRVTLTKEERLFCRQMGWDETEFARNKLRMLAMQNG